MAKKKLEILKALDKLGKAAGLKSLAAEANLSVGEVLGNVRGLVSNDYVKKSQRSYLITDKGRTALKVLSPTLPDKAFKFYEGIDQYTGVLAKSLEDFLVKIKGVDSKVLEFHTSRGDFENWVLGVFGDKQLASKLGELRPKGLEGEELRSEVSKAFNERYRAFQSLS